MPQRRGPKGPRRFSFHPTQPESVYGTSDVLIFDTTLRDGEQAPGNSLTPEEKLRLARQLDALGVDVIEAGFPAASEGTTAACARSPTEIRRPVIAALARCTRAGHRARRRGARRAAERIRLHVFISTSDLHMREKLRLTRDEVRRARPGRGPPGPPVHRRRGVLAPRTRAGPTPTSSAGWSQAAIEEGATTVNLPDTVGYAMPDEYAADVPRRAARGCPGADRVVLSAHCHDDLGLAVANSLAAIAAGARQVECTVNGIGERAGNAALEEIVMASARARRRPRLPLQRGAAGDLPHQPAALLPHRRASPSPTRRSSAGTPSPTRRASISTACCRTGSPTRSSGPRWWASRARPWCWASTRAATRWSAATASWATT